MTFNLIRESWLPVRRRSGLVEEIPPWRITDRIADDPIIGFAWPRPDFNGAAHELLIGLVSTASAPEDDENWEDWWYHPPTPTVLGKQFSTLAPAFDLDGSNHRFMQDMDPLEGTELKEVGTLLIEMPGAKTQRENADLFVKRGRVPALSRAAAAMALFTFHTYAPTGGSGHRTSLRGGGPMTSLIVEQHPEFGATLWGRIWPNVETLKQIAARSVGAIRRLDSNQIFPWMTPTRTSQKKAGGRDTTPADVHPLQVYWGMPRRIRLHFEDLENQQCGLTRARDTIMVRQFKTKTYGTNYSEGFQHPLTPYFRKSAKKTTKLPEHPNPGGFSYRLWPKLTVPSRDGLREPAQTIRHWLHTRAPGNATARIFAFGYDMDKMKARAWVEGEMPLLNFDETMRDQLETFINRATEGANTVAELLTCTVKRALYKRFKVPGDFRFVSERFYRDTEAAFYSMLSDSKRYIEDHLDDDNPTDEPLKQWASVIAKAAPRLFDEFSDTGGMEHRDMRRLVAARHHLIRTLSGRGKAGRSLFERDLGIPSPDKARSRNRAHQVA